MTILVPFSPQTSNQHTTRCFVLSWCADFEFRGVQWKSRTRSGLPWACCRFVLVRCTSFRLSGCTCFRSCSNPRSLVSPQLFQSQHADPPVLVCGRVCSSLT